MRSLEGGGKNRYCASLVATGRTDAAISRRSAAIAGYFCARSSTLPISTSDGTTPGHSVLAPRSQRRRPIKRASAGRSSEVFTKLGAVCDRAAMGDVNAAAPATTAPSRTPRRPTRDESRFSIAEPWITDCTIRYIDANPGFPVLVLWRKAPEEMNPRRVSCGMPTHLPINTISPLFAISEPRSLGGLRVRPRRRCRVRHQRCEILHRQSRRIAPRYRTPARTRFRFPMLAERHVLKPRSAAGWRGGHWP